MVMSAGSRLGRTRVPTVGARPAAKQIATAGTFTGSSTSVFVMAGLALTITPTVTGTLLVNFAGFLTASAVTINEGTILQIAYGTGNAPANNAAATGTVVGEPQRYQNATALTTAADLRVPIALHSLITGLTLGVTYWIDIQVEAVTGTSVITTNDPVLTAIELGGSQPATSTATQSLGAFGPAFGGRLTLTSGTPVLVTNTTAQGTVYFTPADGPGNGWIAIYNGVNWANYPFTEQNVVLDTTNFLSTKAYDWFMFLVGTTPTLGYGPAWTTAAGPGTRSAALARLNGIQTNSATITLRTSASQTFSVSANQATWIGSTYATANGQTGMAFTSTGAGGGAGILGVYNPFNQVLFNANEQDTTANWTYAVATWRHSDGNANNSVSYFDGEGTSSIVAIFNQTYAPTSGNTFNGIGFNWSSGAPVGYTEGSGGVTASNNQGLTIQGSFVPVLGFNVISALEIAENAATVTYNGSPTYMLSISLMM
jgi:hypothetical protein